MAAPLVDGRVMADGAGSEGADGGVRADGAGKTSRHYSFTIGSNVCQ